MLNIDVRLSLPIPYQNDFVSLSASEHTVAS